MRALTILAAFGILALAASAADEKEELAKAAKKVAEADSYAFKTEIQVESPLGGAAGGQIPSLEGKYQKDVGTYVKAGDRGEFFRKGDKIYVKTGQGDWQDGESFQGGGQDQGGRRRQMGRMMLRNMKAPHEELKDFQKSFKEAKKDEKKDKVGEKDCTVYSGDLSEDGIKASPLGRMLGQFGGAANAEVTGKGKAWIDANGNLVKYELLTKVSAEFNGNAVEFSMTRTSEISGAGRTKLEVPEGVAKLLSGKSEEKKEEPKKEEKKKDF